MSLETNEISYSIEYLPLGKLGSNQLTESTQRMFKQYSIEYEICFTFTSLTSRSLRPSPLERQWVPDTYEDSLDEWMGIPRHVSGSEGETVTLCTLGGVSKEGSLDPDEYPIEYNPLGVHPL